MIGRCCSPERQVPQDLAFRTSLKARTWCSELFCKPGPGVQNYFESQGLAFRTILKTNNWRSELF